MGVRLTSMPRKGQACSCVVRDKIANDPILGLYKKWTSGNLLVSGHDRPTLVLGHTLIEEEAIKINEAKSVFHLGKHCLSLGETRVEVKPGNPITHYCKMIEAGFEFPRKTIVQCNVGKRSPVLLCELLTNKIKSCHLYLEFEEPDDVVFLVIGPRSVYRTGYYVQKIRQSNMHSDTESYGMDIENTHTEGSSYGGDDENYDDSFIKNDAELQFSPRSPVNNEASTLKFL
ncbi:peptidyl-prolyl cis-trans isomerase fkbp43 [Phtheirospermum japonicum]|uniref:peptidylprolyl isomerase n=1 Tax=Phtheirospermum japonicum TaxID=374723 RepID=A0A830DD41_9LAMI|nr:peptidyl-prolyl cis-trans isomerase fkbp43 [Phtheirospermum japonicum]